MYFYYLCGKFSGIFDQNFHQVILLKRKLRVRQEKVACVEIGYYR